MVEALFLVKRMGGDLFGEEHRLRKWGLKAQEPRILIPFVGAKFKEIVSRGKDSVWPRPDGSQKGAQRKNLTPMTMLRTGHCEVLFVGLLDKGKDDNFQSRDGVAEYA